MNKLTCVVTSMVLYKMYVFVLVENLRLSTSQDVV